MGLTFDVKLSEWDDPKWAALLVTPNQPARVILAQDLGLFKVIEERIHAELLPPLQALHTHRIMMMVMRGSVIGHHNDNNETPSKGKRERGSIELRFIITI